MKTGSKAAGTGHAGGADGIRSITMQQLERVCDDPARDKPGGINVRALLTFEPETGFHLMARDGDQVYQVTDEAGDGVRFRTIEAALAVLQGVSGLSPDIGIFLGTSRGRRH